MTEGTQSYTTITPRRVFNGHQRLIATVAVFPDGRRMVTGSNDKTLRLWDLKDGIVLKKMEGHRDWVNAVVVSKDGKWIASGDDKGELFTWDGDTGESLTKAIKAHTSHTPEIISLDFSPNSAMLATASRDGTIKLRRTETWNIQGKPINSGEAINCVRYSPSGELLAIGTLNYNIQIWNRSGSECVVKFRADGTRGLRSIFADNNLSLAWTPDGTRLISGGSDSDPSIREWDTSTWKQVGDPCSGHFGSISALVVDSTGTLIASASRDRHMRIWRLSDRRTIAIFSHFDSVYCGTFSTDGKSILCGGGDAIITEWDIPKGAFLEDTPNDQESDEIVMNSQYQPLLFPQHPQDFTSRDPLFTSSPRHLFTLAHCHTFTHFTLSLS